jgi:hypothetical protein
LGRELAELTERTEWTYLEAIEAQKSELLKEIVRVQLSITDANAAIREDKRRQSNYEKLLAQVEKELLNPASTESKADEPATQPKNETTNTLIKEVETNE